MLAALVCMVVLGLLGQQLLQSKQRHNDIKQGGKIAQAQSLQQSRQSLLAFASLQGFNSHTQLGHLPCPSNTPGGPAQTTCLQKPWGYLPVQSVSKVNYLNAGLPAVWNGLDTDLDKHWMYAVSQQVIQANALGWSQWVNFDLPTINVRIGQQVHTGVVAIIAQHIEPLAEDEYVAQEPALLLHLDDLQALIRDAQEAHLLAALRSWGKPPFAHENLKPANHPTGGSNWQAVNSECQCRCTKTRCTCSCEGEGQWASAAACDANNPRCTKQTSQSGLTWQCTSTPSESCVFSGPAQLQTQWPVSRFEPVASAAKSCRPNTHHTCPLSPSSTACICLFSWPDPVLSSLDRHTLSWKPGAQSSYAIER